MCELFGVCSKFPLNVNDYLGEFYSHSCRHPHGWGLAVLDKTDAQIEKEPMQADKSNYLKERLSVPVIGKVVFAHIRYATIGNVYYRNCHPYTGLDCTGRRWTMIHNGTIFDYPILNEYMNRQQGDTDSERIFLHLLNRMNKKTLASGALNAEERFRLLDCIFSDMSRGNKLNLILYDGECVYVHTNYENSLHVFEDTDRALFSTEPLDQNEWKPLPMTTLLAYRDGNLLFTGTNHGNVYVDSEENMKYLYQIFSNL